MIYVSTMLYALGKELGVENARDEFARQLMQPNSESLPVVRVIERLRQLDSVGLSVEPGATCIGKTRSRAFFDASQHKADVWVSCDDDVEADMLTLETLLRAVGWRAPRGLSLEPTYDEGSAAVCFAPCLLRGSDRVAVATEPDPRVREVPGGGKVVSVTACGFGLVAMNRAAMHELEAASAHLAWHDDDGKQKLALFLDRYDGLHWWGEDLSFCWRALCAGVPLEALTSGVTVHAGQGLLLDEWLSSHPRLALQPEI